VFRLCGNQDNRGTVFSMNTSHASFHGKVTYLVFYLIQELSSSWDERPFRHNRHGPKSGGWCAPFRGGADPHLTQCRLSRCLSAYQVTSWSI